MLLRDLIAAKCRPLFTHLSRVHTADAYARQRTRATACMYEAALPHLPRYYRSNANAGKTQFDASRTGKKVLNTCRNKNAKPVPQWGRGRAAYFVLFFLSHLLSPPFFSLPPSRNSDPVSHKQPLLPPAQYGPVIL